MSTPSGSRGERRGEVRERVSLAKGKEAIITGHIFSVETFTSPHKRHQSGYLCMYKRILEHLGERGHGLVL